MYIMHIKESSLKRDIVLYFINNTMNFFKELTKILKLLDKVIIYYYNE